MGELYDARRPDLHRRRRLRRRRRRDAARARVRGVAARARSIAQHAEDRALAAGGHMHEGAWSSRLGIPGRPAAAETTIVARDLELARLTGAPVHFLHLSTAGTVDLVRAAKAAGRPGDRRGRAAPLLAHRRRVLRGFDPVFKVNPPLRTDADVARHPRGTRRRHHRRHRHRPRAAHAGDEGAPVRGGAAGHARRSRPRSRSRSPSSSSPGILALARRARAAVVAARGASPGSTRTATGAGRAGQPGEPLRVRPGRASGSSTPTGSRAGPATRRSPVGSSAAGCATRVLRGEPGVLDGEAHAMSAATRVLVLRDGEEFEGEAIGALRRGQRRRDRRGRVQHRAVGLPGDRHRPVATRARSSRSPTRTSATTASNPDDDESRRPFCAGVVVRDLARRPQQLARRPSSLDDLLARHGVPGITGIDTRRLTRHLRDAGALPGAFGTDETAVRAAAADGARRTDGIDLVAAVTTDEPVHRRRATTRRSTSSPTTSASSARSCATWSACGCCVEVVPASTTAARRPRPRPGRRLPLERPRRPRRGRRRDRRGRAGSSGEVPGVRHLPRPPDPRPRARRPTPSSSAFGHHGGEPPGAPRADRPGRDHQPEPQLRGRRRLGRRRRRDHPREPERRRGRGLPGARRAGVLGAAPPRGRPRAARRRATCSTSSPP